jgi:superfamily II DNA/RNA helicase
MRLEPSRSDDALQADVLQADVLKADVLKADPLHDAKTPQTTWPTLQSSYPTSYPEVNLTQANLTQARWMLWILLLVIGGCGWLLSRLLLSASQSLANIQDTPIEQQVLPVDAAVNDSINGAVNGSANSAAQTGQIIAYMDDQNLQAQLIQAQGKLAQGNPKGSQIQEKLVVVPTSAIVHQKTGAGVYIKTDNQVRFQPIESGITVGNQTEVRSGLKGNEQILLSLPNGSRSAYLTPFLLNYN